MPQREAITVLEDPAPLRIETVEFALDGGAFTVTLTETQGPVGTPRWSAVVSDCSVVGTAAVRGLALRRCLEQLGWDLGD